MDLKDVEKTAKTVLELRGNHRAQLMIPTPKGMAIFILEFKNDKEKDLMREKMRELVNRVGCEYYYFITEAWIKTVNPKNPDMPFIRPKELKNKGEALIICEYRKDMTGKQITWTFGRGKCGKIFWIKRDEININQTTSLWNLYLEKEGVSESFDKSIEIQNMNFIKNLAKEYSKKYTPLLQAAKNDKERKAVILEMITEMEDKKREIDNLKRNNSDS